MLLHTAEEYPPSKDAQLLVVLLLLQAQHITGKLYSLVFQQRCGRQVKSCQAPRK